LFYIFSKTISNPCLIRSRIQPDINIKVHKSSCKAPMFPFRLQWDFNFVDRFSKTNPILNFTNNCREVHKLFSVSGPTERRKNMMNVRVAFNNFAANFKMDSTSTEYLLIFRRSWRHSSRYTLMSGSSKQLYTCSIGWHKHFAIEDPNSYIALRVRHSKLHCDIVWWLCLLPYTISFMILSIHFFLYQNNHLISLLISVCIIKPEQTATNLRLSNVNRRRKIKR
jgi:hypothetical protein